VTRYLIDFDSTLVAAETLDVLAEIALGDAPDREARTARVLSLTEQAMSGEIGFAEALQRRLEILQPRREHLPPLIARLGAALTASARRQAAWLAGPNVSIVSGGLEEVIGPVLAELGVRPGCVHANRLTWREDGRAWGVDLDRLLAHDRGKIAFARTLSPHTVVMVGDGWTDLEVWTSGAAARFYAFTEVVSRPAVLARAELTAASLDEVLQQEGFQT
jgi:D-3-phosphoglycerate dehydrogenase